MARGYIYTCKCCDTEYEYCPKCAVRKPAYDAERFCSQAHADIFTILSKNGCHLATAEETLESLANYDLTGLNESVQSHINSLLPKKAKFRKEVVSNEESTQE